MRYLVGLLALLCCPALLSSQSAVLTTPRGDSVSVTLALKVKPDTVKVPAPYPVPGPTVTDTLYCNSLGCSKTKPAPAPAPTPIPEPVVVAPQPTPAVVYPLGKAFGPVGAYTDYSTIRPGPWTLTFQASAPSGILAQINAARTRRMKLVLAMTGGSHANYMTNGVFDRAKWNARMQTFNTATIRDAVAKAVADGTILGASVMDEPHVSGDGGGNTWGPAGTMTKVRVDSLCRYVKTIFPTLPAGVAHRWDLFEPVKSYQSCDFLLTQYTSRIGSVAAYRDGALAMAQRDKLAILFSLNILDGGTRLLNCPTPLTGGPGTFGGNCRMTAAQVTEFGKAFLTAPACGLLMWQHDDRFMARIENAIAFAELATVAAKQPAPPCRRS